MRSSDWSSDVCSSDLNTWTLPAGFMELGETTAQGAMRETQEEAGAQIRLGTLYTLIDVPHAELLHFFYLAEEIGQATCREGGCQYVKISVGAGYFKKKKINPSIKHTKI